MQNFKMLEKFSSQKKTNLNQKKKSFSQLKQ